MWDTLRLLLTRYLPVCQVLAQQLCWLQWTPPGYCHANSTRPPSVQCSCVELVWEHNLESGVAIIAFNVIFLPRVLCNNFTSYLMTMTTKDNIIEHLSHTQSIQAGCFC